MNGIMGGAAPDRVHAPVAPPRRTIAVDARMADSSGIGRYLREVVPRVVGAASERDFLLLGSERELQELGWRDFPNARIGPAMAPIYSLREQAELHRRAFAGADLFWAPHYNIPLLYRGALVVTVHDVLHLARPDFVRGGHRRFYARAMFRAVRRRARAIICVSAFTADEVVRHVGVERDRIQVIHQGVDSHWFEEVEGDSPHPKPYFLFVGNVKPHKNMRTLVEAFARVRHRISHDLVIVGRTSGFITGDDRAIQQALELRPRVRFTGEIGDTELRRYVGHAEALVIPSFYEGFGLPAIEAMAAGCPVIASDAASLPEVCDSAALYFDPRRPAELADRLQQLASERGLREEMIAAGGERARRFSWTTCATRTREVLESAMG